MRVQRWDAGGEATSKHFVEIFHRHVNASVEGYVEDSSGIATGRCSTGFCTYDVKTVIPVENTASQPDVDRTLRSRSSEIKILMAKQDRPQPSRGERASGLRGLARLRTPHGSACTGTSPKFRDNASLGCSRHVMGIASKGPYEAPRSYMSEVSIAARPANSSLNIR